MSHLRHRDVHNFASIAVYSRWWANIMKHAESFRVKKRRLMAERRKARGGSRSEQPGSPQRIRRIVVWAGDHHFGKRYFRKSLRIATRDWGLP